YTNAHACDGHAQALGSDIRLRLGGDDDVVANIDVGAIPDGRHDGRRHLHLRVGAGAASRACSHSDGVALGIDVGVGGDRQVVHLLIGGLADLNIIPALRAGDRLGRALPRAGFNLDVGNRTSGRQGANVSADGFDIEIAVGFGSHIYR